MSTSHDVALAAANAAPLIYVGAPLTADESSTHRPAPSPLPVLAIAIRLMPMIKDDVAADLVEQLVVEIVGLHEELRAGRTTFSVSLELLHLAHVENMRLKKRNASLLDAQRNDRLRT